MNSEENAKSNNADAISLKNWLATPVKFHTINSDEATSKNNNDCFLQASISIVSCSSNKFGEANNLNSKVSNSSIPSDLSKNRVSNLISHSFEYISNLSLAYCKNYKLFDENEATVLTQVIKNELDIVLTENNLPPLLTFQLFPNGRVARFGNGHMVLRVDPKEPEVLFKYALRELIEYEKIVLYIQNLVKELRIGNGSGKFEVKFIHSELLRRKADVSAGKLGKNFVEHVLKHLEKMSRQMNA